MDDAGEVESAGRGWTTPMPRLYVLGVPSSSNLFPTDEATGGWGVNSVAAGVGGTSAGSPSSKSKAAFLLVARPRRAAAAAALTSRKGGPRTSRALRIGLGVLLLDWDCDDSCIDTPLDDNWDDDLEIGVLGMFETVLVDGVLNGAPICVLSWDGGMPERGEKLAIEGRLEEEMERELEDDEGSTLKDIFFLLDRLNGVLEPTVTILLRL